MAFNTDKNKLQYDLLVKINLSTPFYLSDRDVVINNVLYEGRILNISNHREQINIGFNRKIAFPTINITLANGDRYFTDSIENFNKFWSMVEVNIYTVERGSVFDEDTDLRFRGFVEYNDGVEITPDTITFKVVDFRKKFNKLIPTDIYKKENYPNIPKKMINRPVPILLGDWSTEIPNTARTAEAFVLSSGAQGSTDPTNMKLIVGKPSDIGDLDFIDDVVMICHSSGRWRYSQCNVVNIDLEDGTFEIDVSTWNRTNDPGTWEGYHDDKVYLYNEQDRYFIQCRGNTNAIGTLISNPAIMIRHLLMEYGGMDSDDIDTWSYSVVANYFMNNPENGKARRQIVDKQYLWDFVGEIAWEFGIGIYNIAGKVGFFLRESLQTSGSSVADVLDNDFVQNKIVINIDPDSLYTTKIISKYRFNPNSGSYTKTYELEADATTLPMTSLTNREEEIEFKWAYQWVSIMNRSVECISSYGKLNKVYTFTIGFKGLTWDIGELKAITNSSLNLDVIDIQVCSFSKNYINGTVEIIAYDAYLRDNIGRWTDEDQDNWTDSSEEDRVYWGYATDNSGNCDPLGTDSKDSSWTVS